MVRQWNAALISGGCAGFAVDVSLFPLDTIKTRLQTKQGFRKAGGFKGIYRGIGPAALGSAPGAAAFFTVYDSTKRLMARSFDAKPSEFVMCLHHMTAASLGEIGACVVRVPVEVIKQRTQTQAHKTSWQILRKTLREEKISGLYRGYRSTVLREIPFSLIQFPLWEFMKHKLRGESNHELSALSGALCGMIAGGTAAGLTTPIDVAKTRIMVAKKHDMEAKGKIIPILKDIYKQRGLKGLYVGAIPRILWISAGGFIFLGSYDFVHNCLLKR